MLPNILKIKDNQTMEFGWLIDIKIGWENIPRPFSRNRCFIQFFFIACQVEGYQNMLKLSYRELAFTSYKALLFFKKKVWNYSSWNYSSCLIFCMIFEEKYLFGFMVLTNQTSLSGCLYFERYWTVFVF